MEQKKFSFSSPLFVGVAALCVAVVVAVVWWATQRQAAPVPDGACRPTGCSQQVCADTDVVTTCEFKPEYACYTKAVCERQKNGGCGWTRTEDFDACLAETVKETFADEAEVVAHAESIRITNIPPRVVIVSPLYIKGEARREWFSDDAIDARLLDANGAEVATGKAAAQQDVKGDGFIPFAVQFDF